VLIVANVAMTTSTVAGLEVGSQRCTGSDNGDPDAREECARLATFARQLLDQESHAPVASVTLYRERPSNILNTYGGYADFAIVSFKLSDQTTQAFYVRCGVGIAKELCFDLRPIKPGETMDQQMSYPNPVAVP
jgi:hypothetical protein